MKSPSEPVVIGLDLGGTKILAAVITRDGRILSRAKRKSRPDRGQTVILDRMATTAREAAEYAGISIREVQGVGVGSPGPLDTEKGIVIETPNLPLTQAPIVASLERDLGIPVVLDNDVNVGTLGEKFYGAGQGVDNIVGLFPGTGLGGGIIIDGRLHRGVSMNAGELGHMTVNFDGEKCGCGKRGCLEAYASRTAIVKRIQNLINNGKKGKSPIEEIVNGNWALCTSGALSRALEQGDKAVSRALNEAAEALGVGIGSLCNILGPEKVILGGGVIEAVGDTLLPVIRKAAKENAFGINIDNVDIVPAALGDDAGIMGAAALIWQALEDDERLAKRCRPRVVPVVDPIHGERIVIDGAHYTYDVIIAPLGDVIRRSRRLAKEEHGSPGHLTLQETEDVLTRFAEKPTRLIVGSVNPDGCVDREIEEFLKEENCALVTVSHAEFPLAYRNTPDPKAAVIMLKP